MTRLRAARPFVLSLNNLLESSSDQFVASFTPHVENELRQGITAVEVRERQLLVLADFDEGNVELRDNDPGKAAGAHPFKHSAVPLVFVVGQLGADLLEKLIRLKSEFEQGAEVNILRIDDEQEDLEQSGFINFAGHAAHCDFYQRRFREFGCIAELTAELALDNFVGVELNPILVHDTHVEVELHVFNQSIRHVLREACRKRDVVVFTLLEAQK